MPKRPKVSLNRVDETDRAVEELVSVAESGLDAEAHAVP